MTSQLVPLMLAAKSCELNQSENMRVSFGAAPLRSNSSSSAHYASRAVGALLLRRRTFRFVRETAAQERKKLSLGQRQRPPLKKGTPEGAVMTSSVSPAASLMDRRRHSSRDVLLGPTGSSRTIEALLAIFQRARLSDRSSWGTATEGRLGTSPYLRRCSVMTDDFSARPPRILTTEQRQARDAQRKVEAKEAMRDHEMAQKALHENRKRLKALRLARKAAASK